MRIVIRTIPHAEQRYDTVGDWWTEPDGTLQIRVSATEGKTRFNFALLVAFHELVEAALCKQAGITAKEVDDFDMRWVSPGEGINEPGDDMMAPYWQQHQIASGFERQLAAALGVNWIEYNRVVDATGEDT